MYISFWRGHAARGPGEADGLLPWAVDSLLALAGFESAGDLVDLLTGGAGAAATDAMVDVLAAVACDVLVALAFTLFLDGAPVGAGGAAGRKWRCGRWAACCCCLPPTPSSPT